MIELLLFCFDVMVECVVILIVKGLFVGFGGVMGKVVFFFEKVVEFR